MNTNHRSRPGLPEMEVSTNVIYHEDTKTRSPKRGEASSRRAESFPHPCGSLTYRRYMEVPAEGGRATFITPVTCNLQPVTSLPQQRCGFTLVELLVVISIIALLIALLLPALAQARDDGNTIACASQERQLGIAMSEYGQEWDAYPVWYFDNPNARFGNPAGPPGSLLTTTGVTPFTWQDALFTEMYPRSEEYTHTNIAIFSDPGYANNLLVRYPGFLASDYELNCFNDIHTTQQVGLPTGDWGPGGFYGYNVATDGPYPVWVRPSDVAMPSQTWDIVDARQSDYPYYYYFDGQARNYGDISNYNPPPHDNNSKSNWLFCDGHVELLMLNQVCPDGGTNEPTASTDTFYRMWRIANH